MSATEEDIEMSEEEFEETEESEEEETCIETLTREVITDHKDRIDDYTDDPETPDETARNESIRKFVVQKVSSRLLESFESQLKWLDDANLTSMVKKWKRRWQRTMSWTPLPQ